MDTKFNTPEEEIAYLRAQVADKMERNSDELTKDCQQDDGVSVSILYSELLHQIMG